MKNIERRIGRLEEAPTLRGAFTLQQALDTKAENDTAATKRRCQALLEITDNPKRRADLLNTIRLIDAGKYSSPEFKYETMDERATKMLAIMKEQVLDNFD